MSLTASERMIAGKVAILKKSGQQDMAQDMRLKGVLHDPPEGEEMGGQSRWRCVNVKRGPFLTKHGSILAQSKSGFRFDRCELGIFVQLHGLDAWEVSDGACNVTRPVLAGKLRGLTSEGQAAVTMTIGVRGQTALIRL